MAERPPIPQSAVDAGTTRLAKGHWRGPDHTPCRPDEIAHAVLSGVIAEGGYRLVPADEVTALAAALRPFAELDYAIGDEWRDVCESARAALARHDTAARCRPPVHYHGSGDTCECGAASNTAAQGGEDA